MKNKLHANLLSSPSSRWSISLNKEKNRLATFADWTVQSIDKRLLAQIGFYFLRSDFVKCYFCDVEIGMWQPEDNPVEEHLRYSANCSLLNGRETSNEPLDHEALKRILPIISYDTCGIRSVQTPRPTDSCRGISVNRRTIINVRDLSPQPGSIDLSSGMELNTDSLSNTSQVEHSQFAIEYDRLTSFKDWPKSMKQKPKELAEAGFFYQGKSDFVCCFSCGGGLRDWEETDIPWEQHALWYSKCEYLKLLKGQEFIEEILARKSTSTPLNISSLNPATGSTSNEDNPKANVANKSNLCKICYECEYNSAFFPCMHIIACVKCAISMTKCPYCRQTFTKIMRVFFS